MHDTILYLSPHLDDVVFSCSAHLLNSREAGTRTVVATVFSAGDHDTRKQEDLAALKILQAEHRWLDMLDAPYRNNYFNSFERLIFGDVNDTIPDLAPLVAEVRPSLIVAPLAVGNHIDHRLVFNAVEQLQSRIPILYYEDQPYANIHGATQLRLNQLGYLGQLPNFAAYWNSFQAARYVQTYLPQHRIKYVKERLQAEWETAINAKDATSSSIPSTQTSAIEAYISQIDSFITFNTKPKTETFWEL